MAGPSGSVSRGPVQQVGAQRRVRGVGQGTVTPSQEAETYRSVFPTLMRLAFLLVGSNAVAEDLVHDTFLRCRSRLATLAHPPSYLRAALINACRDHHRKADRFASAPDRDRPDDLGELPAELVELRDALGRLGERRREAVVLRYFEDLDYAEIAELLACREATARSLVARGVEDLRMSMGSGGGGRRAGEA